MARDKFEVKKGIKLRENSVSNTESGEIRYDSNTYYIYDTAERQLLSDTGTQTVTNKTLDADLNTLTNIANASIADDAGISASKIGNGSVSSIEFGYLDGVTSGIQAQLDSKLDDVLTTDGDIIVQTGGSTARLAAGTENHVLQINSGEPAYATISDDNIDASAAIARSKVATGSANNVVINDGSGNLSEEAQLDITRGGTGQSTATEAFDALSPLTTEGDIIVYDGNDNIRLAGGSNGQVLTYDSAETGNIKWAAPGAATLTTYSTSQTLSTSDNVVFADAGSSAFTLTLPAASGNSGLAYTVKKVDSSTNVVTVDGNASETIDGETTYSLLVENDAVEIVCDGSNWRILDSVSNKQPTVQTFTSGSGTYNTPTGVKRIRVRMVGGGGGGGSTGSSGFSSGGNGGNTTFGTSLLVANGGNGGGPGTAGGGSNPGTGGTASLGSGPIGIAIAGGSGTGGSYLNINAGGGSGASSPFGGAGGGAVGASTPGFSAIANSGSGGGGAHGLSGSFSASAGGGAGGYVDAIINNPSSSYSYAVGAGGSGASAGTSGDAGGAGGSGVIIVEEYYS